jgi:alkylation response protein AidB-like acyl-CoA dehydrogenase
MELYYQSYILFGAMSDSGGTSAIRKRGGYRLNGYKIFIAHAVGG